jgi:hypothetical protein
MKTKQLKAGELDALKTYSVKICGKPVGSVRFNFSGNYWEQVAQGACAVLDEPDAREIVQGWFSESIRRSDIDFSFCVCAYCGADEFPQWVESKQSGKVSHGICPICAAETLRKFRESRELEAEFAGVIAEAEAIKNRS